MFNDTTGNLLVRNAVRAVLTGGALAATMGLAHAQTSSQQSSSGSARARQTRRIEESIAPQLLSQAVPAPAPAGGTAASVQLQEVVVTGSRIATPNATSISPVQFVSSKEFAQLGATRVEDVLNRLPQVFADQNSTSINGGTGIETVDLRGLGAARTLVLIDGKRMPYGDNAVPGADLNMIPVPLIENVQILTGGASSIYGADAVAGVVNFKLMQNFEGVKLVANGSGYFHNNDNSQGVIDTMNTYNAAHPNGPFVPAPGSVATGAQKELSFIAGMNTPDGKGNATFYATYRNIAKATQNLYSYSACTMASGFLPGPANPNGPGSGTGKFACSGSLTSYPGTFLFFGPGGTSSLNTVGPTGNLLPISAEPRFNYGPLNYMQAPEETWNSGAFLHYRFNEHAQLYASTMFMSSTSYLQIAPGGDFAANLNVDCANPYLSPSELSLWCNGSTAGYINESFATATTFPDGVTYPAGSSRSFLILRRAIEGGDRVLDVRHQDWRMVLGIKGAIGENWTYDVSYQYSVVNSQRISNDYSRTKMAFALDAVDVLNGVIVPPGTPGATPECRVTAQGQTEGEFKGCVPWNVFSAGGVTPAANNYLQEIGVRLGYIHQHIIDSNFTGDLSQYVQLPTAHSGLQVATGTEYIDWNLADRPDEVIQSGDEGGSGGQILPVSGAIESFSEYVEARLPLIQGKPFAQDLTTDDSFRHSSYGLGYGTNTFSLGLAWKPIQDIRLRGTFTRAVRAPNVTELYTPQAVLLDGSEDPCSGTTPTYSAAQCAREGVTAAEYGHILANPAAQYNGVLGGNPGLQAETATTKSFGLQFTPTFLRNFSASIDYYDIKIDGVIKGIGENTILNDCASQDLFCNLIHRDSHGSLWLTQAGFAIDTLQNVGSLEQKGIDVQLNYAMELGRWGSVNANFTGTHISNYIITPLAALPSSAFDCAGYYGSTCSGAPVGAPAFSWRHDMTVTWDTPLRPLSLTAGWRYLGAVTVDVLNPSPNLSNPALTVANGGVSNTDAHIPAYNYLDLSAAYQVNDAVLVRLGCNNVMDKPPPVIGASDLPSPPFGNGNTLPGTYDWGGRYVFGELDVQF
jgi:iron complex outermembrane receptor protein